MDSLAKYPRSTSSEKADKPATKYQKNGWRRKVTSILAEKEKKLRREIQCRDEEIKEIKKQIKALQSDNKTAKQQIKQLNNQIKLLNKEKVELEKRFENYKTKMKLKVKKLKLKIENTEDEQTKTKTEMTEMKDQVQKLSKKEKEINEVDLQKAISVKYQEIDDLKLKIKEIKAQAGTGPGTDDPQGSGTDPEEDPIIKERKRRIQELEEEVNKLKEEVKSLKRRVKDLEDDRREMICKFEDDRRVVRNEVESLRREVRYLQDDRRVVIIGELCRRLQENIYRCVLPTDKIIIRPRISYKVKELHKFIDERKKLTRNDKKDAKERWAQIKTELNWPDDAYDEQEWEDLIEGLQGLRNVKSHPPITGELKQEVMDAIEDSNNKTFFAESMYSSPEDLKKLLQMFEETENMLKP